MKGPEHGFTLLEALLVLFITVTVLAISQVASFHTAKQFTDERTVAQIKYDLLLTQTTAMRTYDPKIFFVGTTTYELDYPVKQNYRSLPEGTTFTITGHLGREVKYNGNGSPSALGSFYYDGLLKRYKFTLQLGRGRITVE